MAVILEGGRDEFRALAYCAPSEYTLDTLREHGRRFDDNLTHRARERFDAIKDRFNQVDFSEVGRRVRAGLRKLDALWMTDVIQELTDIGRIQHAPRSMIKYIMANPIAKTLHRSNRCEGYGDRYSDPYPEYEAGKDPIYKAVMDGMWQENENGDVFVEHWWMDEEKENEAIDLDEQFAIHSTWNRLEALFARMEEDPTSAYNAQL